jgi:hypothetical protein
MKHSSIVGLLLLTACASVAVRDEPALLVDANQADRAEIVRAVSNALNVTSVSIAETAFTKSSVLLVERTPARDATGQRLSGRDFDKPEQFQLLKHGSQCVLVHARTAGRTVLGTTKCTAELPHR